MKNKSQGNLFLIPTSIEQDGLENFLVEKNKIKHINNFIVENEKTARASLKKLNLDNNIQEVTLTIHSKKFTLENIDEYFYPIIAGNDIGLLSDSGNPCIADPGAKIVKRAHELNITVKPLIGPSSILLGLIGSGFNGQKFKFHGYIPIKKIERNIFLNKMQKNIFNESETQIFIETPYRNNQLVSDLLKILDDEIRLCIGMNLTSKKEKIVTKKISEWKVQLGEDLDKQLCIFLIN